ncbi:hypothetical protein [Schleiferilactobacillus harbinensis]
MLIFTFGLLVCAIIKAVDK